MEFLIGIAVLVVLAFMLGGFALVVGLVAGGRAERRDRRTREGKLARREELLDGLFDGRRVVTCQVRPDTLPSEVTIEGAGARGYDLTHRAPVGASTDSFDMVFTKRD